MNRANEFLITKLDLMLLTAMIFCDFQSHSTLTKEIWLIVRDPTCCLLFFRLGSYLFYGTNHNITFAGESLVSMKFRTFGADGLILLVDKELHR